MTTITAVEVVKQTLPAAVGSKSRKRAAQRIVDELSSRGLLTDGELPEIWGAGDFAKALGTTSSNLYKYVGLPEPDTKKSGVSIWRADRARAYIEARNAEPPPPPPRSCPRHGTEHMRTPPSGNAYCAACNRERARKRKRTPAERRAEHQRRKARQAGKDEGK